MTQESSFYSTKELAEILKVSERTIYRWCENEQDPIPHIKIKVNKNYSYRFPKDEVWEWIKRHR